MSINYIVVRRSPHWPTFDLRDSRDFCTAHGLPADLIVDFARNWDAVSKLDFCAFREAMKVIAHQSLVATGGTIIDARDLDIGGLAADDALIPIDDDDWLHPDVFTHARNAQGDAEGCLWGSVFVGKLFGDTPAQDRQTPYVYQRDLDDVVYTNNYMVSGDSWRRRGADTVFDHVNAQQALREGRLALAASEAYLSAANKHICATTCVFYNTRTPDFVADLPGAIAKTVEASTSVQLTEKTRWLGGLIDQTAEVMRACQR